ncbi:hypothetical protein EV641_10636 [Rhodococcus sp. SMB37]|nr:hypothetical protein EV641_10636 [Rhodococcus sp. SMB37]
MLAPTLGPLPARMRLQFQGPELIEIDDLLWLTGVGHKAFVVLEPFPSRSRSRSHSYSYSYSYLFCCLPRLTDPLAA